MALARPRGRTSTGRAVDSFVRSLQSMHPASFSKGEEDVTFGEGFEPKPPLLRGAGQGHTHAYNGRKGWRWWVRKAKEEEEEGSAISPFNGFSGEPTRRATKFAPAYTCERVVDTTGQ